MRNRMKKGFSLIEIGIVMVVIGLIIAAVMKGKDVIRGAEHKEVAKTFMDKWVNAADSFYDKTGYNLTADGNTSMMITEMDGSTVGDKDTNGTCEYVINQAATEGGTDLRRLIKTNTDSICKTIVTGEFTGESNVYAGLLSTYVISGDDAIVTAGQSIVRNLVLFTNVPADVAHAFEKLVDSKVDGERGKVIAVDAYDSMTRTNHAERAVVTGTALTAPTAYTGGAYTGTTDGAVDIKRGDTLIAIPYGDTNEQALYTIAVILEH